MIAFISDSHFDAAPNGRLAECIRIHDWIADDLERRAAERDNLEVIIHGGDVFERKSVPQDRNAVAAWLQRLAAIAPVLLVRGNHDQPGDLAIFAELKGDCEIFVDEVAGVHSFSGVDVATLPWPRKAELLAALGRDVAGEETGAIAQEALRSVLRGLGGEMRGAAPTDASPPSVLVAHAMVRGSLTSTGQPLVGHDMELSLDDLALAGADMVLLGHIHMPQHWSWAHDEGAMPIVYAGSPRRTAYGEVEAKGYVLVDFDRLCGRWMPRWERVETPCQPMVLIEYSWDGGAFMRGGHQLHEEGRGAVEGADIRLRYHVPADQRDAARAAAAEVRAGLLEAGAERVTVDECVLQTTTARDTTVAAAKTTADKLTALWALRGDDVAPERRARVLGRLAELEAT
jgi:exonuclease SbcD